MNHQLSIGHSVTILTGKYKGDTACVVELHPFYPDQKWYKVKLDKPNHTAVGVEYFPDNAYFDYFMETELVAQ